MTFPTTGFLPENLRIMFASHTQRLKSCVLKPGVDKGMGHPNLVFMGPLPCNQQKSHWTKTNPIQPPRQPCRAARVLPGSYRTKAGLEEGLGARPRSGVRL